jgi:hypothetical protein
LNDAIAVKYSTVDDAISKSNAANDIGNRFLNIIFTLGLFVESKIVKVPSEYAKTSSFPEVLVTNGKLLGRFFVNAEN